MTRKTFAFALVTALAVALAPGLSTADHCDRNGRGYGQVYISSGQAGIPGTGQDVPNELPNAVEEPIEDGFPNGILGQGSTRANLGGYGCNLEHPGQFPGAVTATGVIPRDMPSIYSGVNTNVFTPGATHFTPWVEDQGMCVSCNPPSDFRYDVDKGDGFGADVYVKDISGNKVIWDANSNAYRARDPIRIPSGTDRIRVKATVYDLSTPENVNSLDRVEVSRVYGWCRSSFGGGNSGNASVALDNVPRQSVCTDVA